MRTLISTVCVALLVLSLGSCNRKSREEKGKRAAEGVVDYAKGVGEGMKEKGKEAGQAVGEGTGTVIKGLVQGVDGSLNACEVRVGDSLASRGVRVTRGQSLQNEHGSNNNGITLYIVFDQPLAATVLLKALDKSNTELGRCLAEVSGAKDEAKFVDFKYDRRVALHTAERFVLELSQVKPSGTAPAAATSGPATGAAH